MNVTLLVAAREFTERLRSKAFLISNAGIMGVLVLALLIPLLIGTGVDPVQLGHVGDDAAEVAALAEAQQQAFDVEVEVTALADREAAEAAMDAGEVEAVLLDAGTVLIDGPLGPRTQALLRNASSTIRLDAALDAAGVAPGDRATLLSPEPLAVEQRDDDGIDPFAPGVGIVFGAVFLLYGLLAVYGQWVAQGIVEEKQSRVIEVLLSSLRPTELLAGKILGLGALGLAQILLLAGIAAGGLLVTDVIEVPSAAWGGLALVIPWYVLGFLLYATVFAVAGSVVSRVEDLQSAVIPVMVVLVVALFAAQLAIADPTGTIAAVAAVVPLTAPIVQPVLLAAGASSPSQVTVAIVLAVVTIALMIPLAARIYRGGSLRTRGKVSYREAWAGSRR